MDIRIAGFLGMPGKNQSVEDARFGRAVRAID
jgi:hypothetical protein